MNEWRFYFLFNYFYCHCYKILHSKFSIELFRFSFVKFCFKCTKFWQKQKLIIKLLLLNLLAAGNAQVNRQRLPIILNQNESNNRMIAIQKNCNKLWIKVSEIKTFIVININGGYCIIFLDLRWKHFVVRSLRDIGLW